MNLTQRIIENVFNTETRNALIVASPVILSIFSSAQVVVKKQVQLAFALGRPF